MNTSHPTYRSSRTVFPLIAVAVFVLCTSFLANTHRALAGSSVTGSSYSWPVKPFNAPHPVRANFGDPRTIFRGPPTMRSLMASGGSFTFHFGIDISVPDGTAVYAVRSGVVSLLSGRTVQVNSGNGFAAQYWHIVPTVKPGEHVVALQTVLGHTMKGLEHVHFTELRNGRPVNPLQAGHLGPYNDNTKPQVASITFRDPRSNTELLPEYVHGRVALVVNSYDMPTLQVPGIWGDLPIAPAVLTWRIERAKDNHVVVPETTAFDVRSTLPSNRLFWAYYARGSRQNMCTFGHQRAWREPAVLLYQLTRLPFDTTRLANGIYRLVVTAADSRGNKGWRPQIFIVRNGHAKAAS